MNRLNALPAELSISLGALSLDSARKFQIALCATHQQAAPFHDSAQSSICDAATPLVFRWILSL